MYLGDDLGPQEVIGVAKDFHFQSLHQNIMPIMFFNHKSKSFGNDRIILIRYNTRELSRAYFED